MKYNLIGYVRKYDEKEKTAEIQIDEKEDNYFAEEHGLSIGDVIKICSLEQKVKRMFRYMDKQRLIGAYSGAHILIPVESPVKRNAKVFVKTP